MILIFGGAYQGKVEYARRNFGAETVFDCRQNGKPGSAGEPDLTTEGEPDLTTEGEPDLTADVICGIEAFVEDCCRRGVEAADWFRQRRKSWEDRILIIQDVSQGLVPMEAEKRAAREMNGRLMIYLAGEADRVIRVFCGIGEEIK